MSTRARKTEKCHDLNQSTYIACQHAGRKNQASNPNEAFSTLKRKGKRWTTSWMKFRENNVTKRTIYLIYSAWIPLKSFVARIGRFSPGDVPGAASIHLVYTMKSPRCVNYNSSNCFSTKIWLNEFDIHPECKRFSCKNPWPKRRSPTFLPDNRTLHDAEKSRARDRIANSKQNVVWWLVQK